MSKLSALNESNEASGDGCAPDRSAPRTCRAVEQMARIGGPARANQDAGIEVKKKKVRVDLEAHPELLVPGGVVWVRAARLLLVRSKKKIRAFSTICPHKPKKKYRVRPGLPGKKGKKKPAVLRPGRSTPVFHCAAHGWTFDHKGRATGKARKPLQKYPVRVRGTQVVVRLT